MSFRHRCPDDNCPSRLICGSKIWRCGPSGIKRKAKRRGARRHSCRGKCGACHVRGYVLDSCKRAARGRTGGATRVGIQWAVLPILTLMISVMRVANHRFSTPEDIDGSGLTIGTSRMLVLRAILQNSLEQSVLAVAAYLIWAAVMPHSWLRAIPVAAVLFVVGRILFASGYERGAAGRATGFGLTAYPTFGMLTLLAGALGLRILRWLAG